MQFGLGGGGMGGIGVLMVGLSDTLLVVSALDICGRLRPSYQSSGGQIWVPTYRGSSQW